MSSRKWPVVAMRRSALSSAYGVAPDAHVIADGQTTCEHKANILKQKNIQVPRDPVNGAVPPEAWPPSMPNIRSARPETGSLAGRWACALSSV